MNGFTRRTLMAVGIVVLVLAVGAAFVRAADIFFLFFAAALLAILLRSAAAAVARRTPLGPGAALGVVVLALAGLFAAGAYAVGTVASAQFDYLVADLPRSAGQAREYLRQYAWGDEALEWAPAARDLLSGGADTATSNAARFFSTTLGVLGNLLVLTVATLYLAAAPGTYVSGFLALVPPARRPRAEQVLAAVEAQLRWWLVGRLAAMTAVGLIVGVGLFAVGVPQYLVLALAAGLLTAVPFLGPVLGAVPGILLALLNGPDVALWAGGVYVLAQAVENYLVTPLVQERVVSLPPVLTIATVALVGALFGVVGLVVATPMAVVAQVVVKMLYVEDVLGDALPVGGEVGSR